ncbi:uncharacterized protein LOC143566765 [Bidens hawaiensis]|uniref:uncharacterized protein LOC143566765 n=1 Tax=Bidens hawaiensis TaxID=980011 RepID=UPI00404ADF55
MNSRDSSIDIWDNERRNKQYLKMSEKVARESLLCLCEGVIDLYGFRYLRNPTFGDIQIIYEVHQQVHGFPGMLGSFDCTYWEWAACPTAWRGQHHRGDHNGPTLILEAVASFDLWIWHDFFGMADANNDIAVIQSSPVFDEIIDGVAPRSLFYANDVEYEYGYYHGIYLEWATLMGSFTCPDDDKRNFFKKKHESSRKDIERAFGDSGRAICQDNYTDVQPPTVLLNNDEKLTILLRLRNMQKHLNLKSDLVEHVWMSHDDDGEDE